MAYFPDKTQTKVELQENTTQTNLSCTHLTTANFFELNVGYYRENTPREMWKSNQNIWARPVPMQAPVMGEAVLKLKNYYVPYRVVSPQWNDFITKTPHVPYNGNAPFQVQEMPYTTAQEMINLITNTEISTIVTGTDWDFKTDTGVGRKLTKRGRHAVKILNQLGYQIVMDSKCTEHFDMMPLLAFAKVYLDYYMTNQYSEVLQSAYEIEAILKKDEAAPYIVTGDDMNHIFALTENVMYSPDYFTSQWDNPTTPNEVATSLGNIRINDITTIPTNAYAISDENQYNGTPYMTNEGGLFISQYALDALKGLTDFVKRLQGSVRNIDRYLARFGVILTNEKMQRSQYNGEQITPMSFGAVYSTAETDLAKVGDYAGQGMINGGTNNEFKYEQLDEYGCILSLFSINPKIGYYQGIDRQHLIRNVESYFNGQWDSLGTQATSAAELYVSPNGQSIYGRQAQFDTIFGYLPRNAHHKVGKDRLTGDFVRPNINAGAEAWHLFRKIDESQYDQTTNNMVHSPTFVQTREDSDQYNRIFNYQSDDSGDMFNVCLQFAIEANIHGKALYDDYDFEGEGKKIIMDGVGPKQN